MDTKFQSKTFKFGFPEGEQFETLKNDIYRLKTFDSSKIEKNFQFVMDVVLSTSEEEKNKIYEKIFENKLTDSRLIVDSLYQISHFFLKSFSDKDTKDDNIDTIVQDIAKKLEIEENELFLIKKLLILIKKHTEQYYQNKLITTYSKGLFPFIESVGTSVELRGVFNEGTKVENEINEKHPVIPIISVAIALDSGNPNRFCFQGTPHSIEFIIEKLKVALLQSKILEEKYEN